MSISESLFVSGNAIWQKHGKLRFLLGISLLPLILAEMAAAPVNAAQPGATKIEEDLTYDGVGTNAILNSGEEIAPATEFKGRSAVTVSNGASLTIGNDGGPVTINAENQEGLLVTGGGATVVSTGAIINSAGTEPRITVNGVDASAGGQVTLNGGAVTLTKSASDGGQASAIVANGPGSHVTANSVNITSFDNANNDSSSNYMSFGVSTLSGGTVTVNGGAITADARDAQGNVRTYGVNAANGAVELNNVDVHTYGSWSHGVVAAGGTVTIQGGSVSAEGTNVMGLYSAGNAADSYISATGTRITSSNTGVGLDVGSNGGQYSATIDVRNSQILAGQYGLSADGTGLLAGSSRTINVADSNVVVTGGAGAFGASVDTGGVINMTGSTLSAISGGNGVHIANGGVFTAAGTNIAASGVGFQIEGSGPNRVVMSGGSLSAGAEAFKINSNTGSSIQLSDVRISNGPVFLNASGGGTVALNMTNINAQGDVISNDGSVVDMNLINSTITGKLPDGSSANLGVGSAWQVTRSTTFASLSNSGTIGFASTSAPGNTLTVEQGYASNGGTVNLNVVLRGDNAPADKLVVTGNASGSSYVNVNNFNGGGGGLTQTGIKLVDLNGSSSANFILNGRVASGAYDYTLTSGGPGGNDGDWYLRSNVYDPRHGWVPNYRPEVAVNSVIAPLALEYGYALLGTLDARTSTTMTRLRSFIPAYEERIIQCPGSGKGENCVIRVPVNRAEIVQQQFFTGAWGRLFADRSFRNNGDLVGKGADYNYTLGGIQAGLNLWARRQPGVATDSAGLYIGYGEISANVKGVLGAKAGTIDMDAYTFGAYWTHRADSNWYTDTVLQGTWYATDAKSVAGEEVKPDGFGILGSIEGGYIFKLGNGVSLEPQAQVIYQSISFGDASDRYGKFAFDNGDSLRGRVGLRLAKSLYLGDPQNVQIVSVWSKINVWHEFLGNAGMSVSGLNSSGATQFSSPLTGTWGEISAGISQQFTDAAEGFVSASYQHSIDDNDVESWDGRVGLILRW